MFDYYGMPGDTPAIGLEDPDIYKRINKIEAAINQDIGQTNCMFHFMLHEFEGILFSNPQSFQIIADQDIVNKISEIRKMYPTPEHINNSFETAPSKRLEKLIPNYAKIKNGILISKDMGIDKMIDECPHFREWVEKSSAIHKVLSRRQIDGQCNRIGRRNFPYPIFKFTLFSSCPRIRRLQAEGSGWEPRNDPGKPESPRIFPPAALSAGTWKKRKDSHFPRRTGGSRQTR